MISFILIISIFNRRILLEEASVSLRLYHLHYFSERALLVGSSPIHGCGLFTLIDLVEGQMIIEYTGEVVRPCLTDKRERENEGKVNELKMKYLNIRINDYHFRVLVAICLQLIQ